MVAARAREVIHVAGLGHADGGMNQKICLRLLGGAERQLNVSAVHGIARLERHHTAPALAGKLGAQFRRSVAEHAEIVVRRRLQAFHFAADIPRLTFVDHIIRARMRRAGGSEYRFRLGFQIRLPDFLDVQHRQHDALGIAQRNLTAARLQRLGKFFAHVEGNRDGPKRAVRQPHVVADSLVVGARHETAQGRKASAHQQFEIADLARCKVPRRPFARVGFEFSGPFGSAIRFTSSPPCGETR